MSNAPSEKITVLWNLYHFFQFCFTSKTQVLMTVSDFSAFCSRNHFLEGGFFFQWGEVVFQLGVSFIFKWSATPRGWHRFWWEKFSKKVVGSAGTPYYGKSCMWRSIISLSKIANQMWPDHAFSQRNKTTERAVGVGETGERRRGWIKFQKMKVGNIGGSL